MSIRELFTQAFEAIGNGINALLDFDLTTIGSLVLAFIETYWVLGLIFIGLVFMILFRGSQSIQQIADEMENEMNTEAQSSDNRRHTWN